MRDGESGLNSVRGREHSRNGIRWTKRWYRPWCRWGVLFAPLCLLAAACGGSDALAPVQDGADLEALSVEEEEVTPDATLMGDLEAESAEVVARTA